jgi:hypothetical protein
MYTPKKLDSEIEYKIEEMETLHPDQDIQADWVAQAIMLDHPLPVPIGEDGFHHYTEYRTVREHVRRVMSRYDVKASPEPDRQLVLPGCERVQTHYLVDRGGQQCMVSVNRMTDKEIDDKAAELVSMGMGCYQHSEELLRYKEKRSSQAVAA